jgi:O-acetyl-ADP-ribose deacetylase (regulator of RNase III)
MLVEAEGNLLQADADALVNTVNTVGVMGKGIALQFKQAYPANYQAYEAACRQGEVRLGRMFVTETGMFGSPRIIVNFPTKRHWRTPSHLADIEAGLTDLRRVIGDYAVASIAVPPLGCGNGGLDWRDVRPLIANALGNLPGVRVIVYPPKGAPSPDSMPVRTDPPSMTAGRAALLSLVAQYVGLRQLEQPAAPDGASLLEIQKLMYFLQEAGQPLRLSFAKARYGPYAENLNPVLQVLEGHYLRGYGDRSQEVRKLSPITLLPGAEDQAQAGLPADSEPTAARIDTVLSLITGFASAYGLELLATVHWVMTREGGSLANPDALSGLVRSWSQRKSRLFTDAHVCTAAEHLAHHGWLAAKTVPDA